MRRFQTSGPITGVARMMPGQPAAVGQPVARGQPIRRLGSLPPWDQTNPSPWPRGKGVLYPPAGTILPGGSYAPPAPGVGSPSTYDWRVPTLTNYVNFPVMPSAIAPAFPVNYWRTYFLVQNNDPAQAIIISFGSTPSLSNSLFIPGGGNFGFEWEINVPFSSIYIAAPVALSVNPIGIEGTQIDPATLPAGILAGLSPNLTGG